MPIPKKHLRIKKRRNALLDKNRNKKRKSRVPNSQPYFRSSLKPFSREKVIEDGIVYEVHRNNNEEYWYKDKSLHREGDNPAIIYTPKSMLWYLYGKKHRAGFKPAIILGNGEKAWFRHGKEYNPYIRMLQDSFENMERIENIIKKEGDDDNFTV
jgi:hypothetical protein